uniref:Uncharacterized protein n=1 Tax=Brassica oleracea TaxID=3712 RepID=A0A3P6DQ24_BRAOL|nr:unnamed protein product [Brassica oleracea]
MLIGRRINPDWSDMLKLVCGGAYSLMDQILIRLLFQVVFIMFGGREISEGTNRGLREQIS